MIVVDASVVLETLLTTPLTEVVEERLLTSGDSLHVPCLLDVEVAHVLRRYALARRITSEQGRAAVFDLATFPARRYPHEPLLGRIWELRENLSAYDATYAALAEALDAVLVTRDQRLANAPGIRAAVEVIGDLRGFHEP